MTLPAAFPLSASQINVELGRAGGAAFDIQGAEERLLAQVPAGAISMSNFLGKSKRSVTLVYSSFAGGKVWNSVPLGTHGGVHRNFICIIHGTTASDPGLTPSLLVNGVAATRLSAHSTGDVSPPPATGLAWFEADPTVDVADISATWGGMTNLGIIVLSAFYYTTFVEEEGDGASLGGSDGIVGMATQNDGVIIAGATYGSIQTVTWTEMGASKLTWTLGWAGSTNNSGAVAWLEGQNGSSILYHVNPHPGGQGNYLSAWISIGP